MPDINTPPTELPAGFFGTILQRNEHITGTGFRGLGSGYNPTPLDVIYLTIAVAYEDSAEPDLTVWAMLRRFVGMYCRSGGRNGMKRIVETFSQTINPAWANWWPSLQTEERITGRGRNRQTEDVIVSLGNPIASPRPQSSDVNLAIPGPPTAYAAAKFGRHQRAGNRDVSNDPITRRRNRIVAAQKIFAGGGEGRSEWTNIASWARDAVYTTLRGGHAPPAGFEGFDDFASGESGEEESFTVAALYSMTPEERETELRLIQSAPMGGKRGGRYVYARFTQGGEYYVYHSSGAWSPACDYGIVYISGPLGNSDSSSAVSRHFSGGTNRTSSSGLSGGGVSGSYTGTTTISSVTYDAWSVVDDTTLRSNFQRYASNGITELGALSNGRRTRI